MLIRLIFAVFVLMLSACQSLPKVTQIPTSSKQVRTLKITQQQPLQQQSLLTVQFTPEYWRWVQVDPLGSPLARLRLTAKGWQNDGFVMPNRQAQWLFSAIATQLSPENPPFDFSVNNNRYYAKHKYLWQITPQADSFQITLNDQSVWHIEEIN